MGFAEIAKCFFMIFMVNWTLKMLNQLSELQLETVRMKASYRGLISISSDIKCCIRLSPFIPIYPYNFPLACLARDYPACEKTQNKTQSLCEGEWSYCGKVIYQARYFTYIRFFATTRDQNSNKHLLTVVLTRADSAWFGFNAKSLSRSTYTHRQLASTNIKLKGPWMYKKMHASYYVKALFW
jgi:hypothetical protein